MAVGSVVGELGTSLRRNLSMTVSLVVTMTVSLLLAALGLLIQQQADRTEQYFGDRLQLQVNMCTDNSPNEQCIDGAATDQQQGAVEAALRDNPEVQSFDERTPEQNFERAREYLGQTATGRKQLQTLGADAFPVSYFVTLDDPREFDGVTSQVSGMDGVGSVNSLRDLLGPLFEALGILRWAALGTALVLVVAAILQVSNTIRMTAFARRREIGIMRLVGASSWHVQAPFVLESLVAAVVSAVLACGGLAAFMHFAVYGYLRPSLGQITTWVRWQEAFVVGGWITVLAVLLALVPTLVMTRKYLKV